MTRLGFEPKSPLPQGVFLGGLDRSTAPPPACVHANMNQRWLNEIEDSNLPTADLALAKCTANDLKAFLEFALDTMYKHNVPSIQLGGTV